MSNWDVLLWAIIGLLLINHIRLNFLLMKTNQFCIIMASQTPTHLAIYLPLEDMQHLMQYRDGEAESQSNNEVIKKWDEGG